MFSPTLAFLVEYLDLPAATGDPEASWEAFQIQHLNNAGLLGIELKARQVGWSWLVAAEAVASGCITPRIPHIFVSINQEEAGEKIRYAKAVIESLDREARPKLIIDNRYEIEFANGSRLISHPCRPVRGKAKARIYLDEFAHYPNDKEIYQSSLPALSKGGFMRIGSSPLGARGMFWEIYTESMRQYPGYFRGKIPWWSVVSLCKDVPAARLVAPGLDTETRCQQFGTARLIQIYQNMPLEDFQQEYECAWLDESISWIDWELIKRNQQMAAGENLWYRRAKTVDAAMAVAHDIIQASREARIEEIFVGGMDIGRKHDTTEIVLLGVNSQTHSLPYRLGITLDRIEFEQQKAVVSKLLDMLPITNFLIDQNGIGMQMAEQLSTSYPQAQGVTFSNATKQVWAVEAKLRAQRAEVPIPLDRDLAYQIHSIRRKVTPGGSTAYDTQGDEKHHADMFWAWALAIWAGNEDAGNTTVISGEPLFSGWR